MAVIDIQQARQEFLEREIRSLTSHINAATCRWLLLVGEYDEAHFYADWDMRTMVQWLGWHCSMSAQAAREHVRVARALRTLPATVEKFEAGALSFSQVRAITRVATPQTEESLIGLASYLTASELERLVRSYRNVQVNNSEEELDEVNRRHGRRKNSYFWDEDGSLLIVARLSSEDGALYINAIESAKLEVPDAALSLEDRELEATRNAADALVEVCRRSLGSQTVGAAEVVIQVDASVIAESASAEAPSEVNDIRDLPVSRVSDGPRLHPETVKRLLCSDPVRTLLTNKQEPLSIGRRSRLIPKPMRIALKARDGCCQWSGCSAVVHLDAHHIQFWGEGGETDLENLISLCRYHHRAVHEGGYVIMVTADGFVFADPEGIALPTKPKPLPQARPIEQVTLGLPTPVKDNASASHWENVPIDYSYITSLLYVEEHEASS